MRQITYCEAINEAIMQGMENDSSIFVYGVDVGDHKQIFNTLNGVIDKFGEKRCFCSPLSEDSMTGFGVGAAMNGLRPIHIHIRVDFLMLAMNQISNMLATCEFGSAGKIKTPMIIRAIIGRGWGQGFQHSKSMLSTFAHIPGLRVIAPTTAYDVKGMLTKALRGDEPVICFEHRWLYWQKGNVPVEPYIVEYTSKKIRDGRDITIVALSWMNIEALHAAEILKKYHNIEAEIIDVSSIQPLDIIPIILSVTKTRKCIIIDCDWRDYGVSSEISNLIYGFLMKSLDLAIVTLGFVFKHCPTARHLENVFYPNSESIVKNVECMLGLDHADLSDENFYSHENKFFGPF